MSKIPRESHHNWLCLNVPKTKKKSSVEITHFQIFSLWTYENVFSVGEVLLQMHANKPRNIRSCGKLSQAWWRLYVKMITIASDKWLGAWSAPEYYVNQCWLIVNWIFRYKLQWNLNQNSTIFFRKTCLKMSAATCRLLWLYSVFQMPKLCLLIISFIYIPGTEMIAQNPEENEPKSWLSQEDLDAGCEHSVVPMDS